MISCNALGIKRVEFCILVVSHLLFPIDGSFLDDLLKRKPLETVVLFLLPDQI